MATVLCTSCGINEVPAPDSIEVDPICKECEKEQDKAQQEVTYNFSNYEGGCPGWNDSCGNKVEDGDLCPDCTMARLDAQSPRLQR